MYKEKKRKPLVVGKGKEKKFSDDVWEKWNADACRADQWKHGRVSTLYRMKYDQIKWCKEEL